MIAVSEFERARYSLAQKFTDNDPQVETEAPSFCIHHRDSGPMVTVFGEFKDIADYEVRRLACRAL